MGQFSYKEIYLEEGRRVLEMNILPEKYCNFDCIFCPIGRSQQKAEGQTSFESDGSELAELLGKLSETQPDLVFINSKGEAFVNEQLEAVIETIKGRGIAVRLLTNGYLLGNERCAAIAQQCDEVLGEIKVITEADFQKVQRPMDGYTLEAYIDHMATFNKRYKGVFIFEITLIKGYNDDDASLERLKEIISTIGPDKLLVVRMEDEPFKRKLGVSDERFETISAELQAVLTM